jgi:hypothetical protein
MKQIFFSLLFLVSSVGLIKAQNLQLHYDLGKDRQMFTTTVEMFKPDNLGNTFFFIDMDYGGKSADVDGVSLAYWEIARVFKTEKMPIGIHAEFDAGFGRFNTPGGQMAYRINDAWLGGVDYSWNASDFSKGFSLKGMYKYIADKHDASFQITGVWYLHLFEKKLSFTGFADFWKEDSDFNFDGDADASFVFLAEPQLWYNINEHFSAGGEVELSNNFGGNKGFMVNPTLGAKWVF